MAVSNTADLFYSLFNTFTVLAILVAAVVFSLMVFFLIKFRARPASPDPEDAPRLGRVPPARGHLKTLFVSVTLSSIIVGFLIFGTFSAVDKINTPPAQCSELHVPAPSNPCLIVRVLGVRFYWNFTYEHLPNQNSYSGSHTDSDLLRVPLNTTVILKITSYDVFHDFGIIDFRIKTDAIPGRTNVLWFVANEAGTYTIQCFELCGSGHAFMIAKLSVMTSSDFQGWSSTI